MNDMSVLAKGVARRGGLFIRHGNALELLPNRKIALRAIVLLYALTKPGNADATIGTLEGYSDDERRVAYWAYMTAPARSPIASHSIRAAHRADYRHVAAYLRKMHERTWMRQPYTIGTV